MPEGAAPALRVRRAFLGLMVCSGLLYGLFAPVRVLYLESRLLSSITIAVLLGAYSIVSGFFEIPTGSLADSWGRRRTLLISSVGNLLAIALLAFTGIVGIIAAGLLSKAIAGALGSGATESWYIDKAHDLGRNEVVGDVSRAAALENGGIAVGALVAAASPWLFGDLADTGRSTFVVFTPVLAVMMLVLVVELTIVHRRVFDHRLTAARGDVWRVTWRTLAGGLRTAQAEPVVRRIVLNVFVSTMAVAAFEILTPLRLEARGASSDLEPVTVFGVTIAVAFTCGALSAGLAPRIASRFTSPGRAAGAVTLCTGLAVGAALLTGWIAVVVAYLALWLVGGPVSPLLRGELHQRVNADQRATLLSMIAFSAMVGAGVGAILAGPLADAVGFRWAFLFPIAALLVGAACLLAGELPPPVAPRGEAMVDAAPEPA